jgi:hypothetical protein
LWTLPIRSPSQRRSASIRSSGGARRPRPEGYRGFGTGADALGERERDVLVEADALLFGLSGGGGFQFVW